MICHACEATDVKEVSKPLPQRVGRHKVMNQFGRVHQCANCAEWTIDAQELGRLELQAVIVTFHDAPIESLGGAELRDGRKALGLKQTELAKELGNSVGTVSRWENDREPLPAWIKPAMVGLAKTELQPEPAGPTLELSA